jgi:hypothetical protein
LQFEERREGTFIHSRAKLDEYFPNMYNAEVIIVCMAWNRLLTYPVPGKDAKEF